jgi:hypothetical protein
LLYLIHIYRKVNFTNFLSKAYEADLHDASEFYRWQSEMKAKDADDRWREVERRRLEMAACQQEAIEARYCSLS